MKESQFQSKLKEDLEKKFPGIIIFKTDASQIQGIPDLVLLHKDKWAALECKKDAKANKRPNQKYYVELMNDMSYASIIFPENKEEVMHDLERLFET